MDTPSFQTQFKSTIRRLNAEEHVHVQREAVYQLYHLLQRADHGDQQRVLSLQQTIFDIISKEERHSIVLESLCECVLQLVVDKKLDRVVVMNHIINRLSSDTVTAPNTSSLLVSLLIDLITTKVVLQSNIGGQQSISSSSASDPIVSITKSLSAKSNIDYISPIVNSILSNIERVLNSNNNKNQPHSIIVSRYQSLSLGLKVIITQMPDSLSFQCTNTMVRIAHNHPHLYFSILNTITSTLLYTSHKLISTSISVTRDLLDLLRFPPSLQSNQQQQQQNNIVLENAKNRVLQSLLQSLLVTSFNLDITSQTEILGQLVDLIEMDNSLLTVNSGSDTVPVVVVLAYLLTTMIKRNQIVVIEIFKKLITLIQQTNNNTTIINTLYLTITPLVRLISETTNHNSINSSNEYQQSLKSLLKSIETLVYTNNNQNNNSINNNQNNKITNEIFNMFGCGWTWYNQILSTGKINDLEEQFSNLFNELNNNYNNEKANAPYNQFTFEFIVFYMSPFLIHSNATDSIKIKTVESLVSLVQQPQFTTSSGSNNNTNIFISLLPILMNRIQRDQSADVVNTIYQQISQLASNQICYSIITRAIHPLTTNSNNGSLLPYTIRLWYYIWCVNGRAFGHLQQLLGCVNESSPLELRISAANTILDMCRVDISSGQELISQLSVFLCRDSNPAVLVPAIEALTELCNQEILSFSSAWAVVRKNLGVEEGNEDGTRSPIVLCHLLSFYACGVADCKATPIATMEDNAKLKIMDIVRRVWDLSRHPNHKVRSAAFSVLGQYAQVDNSIVVDPKDINQLISIVQSTKENEVIEKKEEGGEEEEEELENIDTFLKCALTYELNEKRTIKSAHLNIKQTKSIRIGGELVDSIQDTLYQQFKQDSRVGIKQGLLGGLLWALSGPHSSSQAPVKETKKDMALKYKAFSLVLKDIIGELDTTREPILQVMSIGGWNRFMQECFKYYIKNETTKRSLAGAGKQTTPIDEKDLIEKMYQDIKEVIMEVVNNETTSTNYQIENAVVALGALARQLPQTSYLLLESQVLEILNWLDDSNNSTLREGSNQKQIHAHQLYKSSYRALSYLLSSLLDDSNLLVRAIDVFKRGISSTQSESLIPASIAITLFTQEIEFKQLEPSHIRCKYRLELVNELLGQFNQETDQLLGLTQFEEVPDHQVERLLWLVVTIGYITPTLEQMSLNQIILNLYKVVNTIVERCGQSTTLQQVHGVAVVTSTTLLTSCLKLNLVPVKQIDDTLERLYNSYQSTQTHKHQSIYSSIGLTVLIQQLSAQKYSLDLDRVEKLLDSYSTVLQSPTSSTIEKCSAVMGSSILLGSPMFGQKIDDFINACLDCSTLDLINSFPQRRKDCQVRVNRLLQDLTNTFLNDQGDSRVIRMSAWALGSLSLESGDGSTSTATSGGANSIPENLDHLGDDLLVKSLFTTLQQKNHPKQICIALSTLYRVDGKLLPLVNWGSVIKRLFTMNDNEEIRKNCIEFSCRNISLSTCSINVTEWLSLAQFQAISIGLRQKLIESLPMVLNHLPISRIHTIVSELIPAVLSGGNSIPLFNKEDNQYKTSELIWNVLYSILNGGNNVHEAKFIQLALDLIPYLPNPITKEQQHYKSVNQQLQVLELAIKTLSHIPTAQLDKVISIPLQSSKDLNTFTKECTNCYIYSSILNLKLATITTTSTTTTSSQINRVKSWCFSINQDTFIQLVTPLLPSLIVNQLTISEQSPPIHTTVINLLDSLLISTTYRIGITILSNVLETKLSKVNGDCQSIFTKYLIPNCNNLSTLLQKSIKLYNMDKKAICVKLVTILITKKDMDTDIRDVLIQSVVELSNFSTLPLPIQLDL